MEYLKKIVLNDIIYSKNEVLRRGVMKKIFNCYDGAEKILSKSSKDVAVGLLNEDINLNYYDFADIKKDFDNHYVSVGINCGYNGLRLAVSLYDRESKMSFSVNRFLSEKLFNSMCDIGALFSFLNECLDRILEFSEQNDSLSYNDLLEKCLLQELEEFIQDDSWISEEEIDKEFIMSCLDELTEIRASYIGVGDEMDIHYQENIAKIKKQIVLLKDKRI